MLRWKGKIARDFIEEQEHSAMQDKIETKQCTRWS